MTFVRLAFFPGGTDEHYRALADAMGTLPAPPDRIYFAAGPVMGGWQVVQVWTSRQALDAFNDAVFFPTLARLGKPAFPAPPTVVDFAPTDSAIGERWLS